MRLLESEEQFRLRKTRMLVTTSVLAVSSVLSVLFSIWAIDGAYQVRDPDNPGELMIVIASCMILVVMVAWMFLRPTAVRLRECLRFRPVKLAWTSITLNRRYSVDVKQIGNVHRDSFYKELVFTLTKPKAVVILNDTEFMREVLSKHKDLWRQWDYSEPEMPFR